MVHISMATMSPETITTNTLTRLPRDVLSMHQSARSSFMITDILAGSNVTTSSTFRNENKNESKKLQLISQHHSCKKAQSAKHHYMDPNQCSCDDCIAPHQKQIAHSFNFHQPLDNYGDFKLENLHSAQSVWYADSNQTDGIYKNLAIRIPKDFCQYSRSRLLMSSSRVGVGTHKLTVQIEQGIEMELGSHFDAVVVNDDKTSTVEDSDSDTCGAKYKDVNSSKSKELTSLTKKQRKGRTAFTDNQLQTLETSFQRRKYLSLQGRIELANELELSDCQVKTWYQNRRTKWKRQIAVGFELLIDAGNCAVFQHLYGNTYYNSWAYLSQLPNIKNISTIDSYYRQAAAASTLQKSLSNGIYRSCSNLDSFTSSPINTSSSTAFEPFNLPTTFSNVYNLADIVSYRQNSTNLTQYPIVNQKYNDSMRRNNDSSYGIALKSRDTNQQANRQETIGDEYGIEV